MTGGFGSMNLDSLLSRCIVTPDGCHIWTGADSGTGRGGNYPKATVNKKQVYIHRYIWTKYRGPIPEGYDVDHMCARWGYGDPWLSRRCVNLDHLQCVDLFMNQRLRHKSVEECPKCSGGVWSGVLKGRLTYLCTDCGYGGRRNKFKES